MRQPVAEISHPPPNDETAKGPARSASASAVISIGVIMVLSHANGSGHDHALIMRVAMLILAIGTEPFHYRTFS